MNTQPILILADPKGKAWSFATRIQEILNAKPGRKHVLGEIEIKKFADGEIFVKVNENVRKKSCFFIHDSTLDPQDWFVSLALINDALMRSSAGEINNVLPYMKFARQDRMAEPRTPISASVLAKMINISANRVLTTDLHNPASAGAYEKPFDNLKAQAAIFSYLKKNYSDFLDNAIIVAPDAGSAKRAESYGKRLGMEVAIINKTRDKSGVIQGMTIIGDVRDKNVLMVDDMIDTGGTICKAAEVLKNNSAKKIYVCATHGVFSKDAAEKLNDSCIEKIIITNSIPQDLNGKIEIVSLEELFAEAIYRINSGDSISELFK